MSKFQGKELDPLKIPANERSEAQQAYVDMIVRQETEKLKARYPEDVARDMALRMAGEHVPPKQETPEPEPESDDSDALGDEFSKP
jgi:hypothetical protein